MDSLPQDIIDDIVAYLAPEAFKPREPYGDLRRFSHSLAPLATVSSRLQVAVERLTFKQLRLNSNELADFRSLLTPPRRYYLVGLRFTVVLPSYNEDVSRRAESPAERAANSEVYTKAMHVFFQTLKTWEVEDPKTVASRLSMYINHPESPSDVPWPTEFAPWGVAHAENEKTIYEGRYLHSYINLSLVDDLPILNRPGCLSMLSPENRYGHRTVVPRVLVVLASKMPNLEVLRLTMDDDEKRFPEIRKKHRDDVAQALQKLVLPRLKTVDIKFFFRKYRNETLMPDVLHDPSIPDPLSTALCQLSLGLVSFEITGNLDPSILHPLQGLSNTPWPNLRDLEITFYATMPSGDWYFTNAPGTIPTPPSLPPPPVHGHSNLHEEEFSFYLEAMYAKLDPIIVFRSYINEETFAPFLYAWADALSVMPKLTTATMSCQLDDASEDEGNGSFFNVSYFAPCEGYKKDPSKLRCPHCRRTASRQLVSSYMGWSPSKDLAERLRRIQDNFREQPMDVKDVKQYISEHDDESDDDDDDDDAANSLGSDNGIF